MISRCKARRQQDEMHCGRCGLTWDVKDPDPPKCRRQIVVVATGRMSVARAEMHEMLRRLKGEM